MEIGPSISRGACYPRGYNMSTQDVISVGEFGENKSRGASDNSRGNYITIHNITPVGGFFAFSY